MRQITSRRRPGRFAAAGIVFAMLASAFAAQSFDNALGRSLFDDGRGRDGRAVIGRVAGGSMPMQGGAVACANCHGKQGSGGSEGWIQAPDIRWFALSKSYGARRAGGEARPPYDRASFAKALRMGLAPDGVALDSAMPRFDLADDEVDALISRLMQLSDDGHRESGRPSLVVLMPNAPTPAADRLLSGLQNCPTASEDGQPPQTLPALRVVRYSGIADIDAQLAGMARDGSAAALFAPYLIGAEDAFARADVRTRLPVVLPMAMRDLGADTAAVFALPGLQAQAQALIVAPDTPAADRLGIVIGAGMTGRESLASSLRGVAERLGWRVEVHTGIEAAFSGEGADALLMLDDLGAPLALGSPINVWVPAAYVVPADLQAWSARGARIRIALPYPPTVGDSARWVPPADAWVAIGCELIARLPPLPQRRDDVDAWRRALSTQPELRLGDWLRLPPVTDADDAAARVFTTPWPPAR
jgi:hypothetical protein